MVRLAPAPALVLAAQEMRFLLDRGYPRERCLSLVGDRRGLAAGERELLHRAVLAPKAARRRREKLLTGEMVLDQPLALDGHNVLLTLETALAGRPLVLADDGVIRDISRAARSHRPGDLTRRALDLILRFLNEAGAAEARFFLDAPLSHSGLLAEMVRTELGRAGLTGSATAVAVPEKELKAFAGVVASADGELIEACPRPIDLAGQIIMARLKEAHALDFTA